MTETGKGVGAMILACSIWGVSALYYRMLNEVPPVEVLAHRTIWSLVFFAMVLVFQRRLPEVATLLRDRKLVGYVLLGALFISVNWFFFIYAVQIGRALEASLGYYIFPLVAVLLGMVFFGERLTGLKALAVALAALAVLVLTIGLGVAPWISLTLAITFGFYGVIKKFMSAGPVVSVTAEVVLIAPLAVIWLFGVHALGWGDMTGRAGAVYGLDLSQSVLLMASGPITAGPLILFSYASRRISLATLGLTQYLNPTLQFLVAVLALGEPLTKWHAIAFPIIWTALALYTIEGLRQDRAARKAAVRDATSAKS